MREKGIGHPLNQVRHAYVRWLRTQGERVPEGQWRLDGWLIEQQELHHRQAPGMTCLDALRRGGEGRIDHVVNDSKGCGGVMRVAPVGLAGASDPFTLAAEAAAITHSHPSGYLSAGAFAVMIAAVDAGASLDDAVGKAFERLRDEPGHEEVAAAIECAIDLVADAPAEPGTVERLGGGWVAEEALAIAVFCSLKAPEFATGVRLAVNHSGDSDSTGSIVGNLLGAYLGEHAIPVHWLDALDARAIVETVADDLVNLRSPDGGVADLIERYPPW